MKKEMAAKEAELKREEARPVIELINNELLTVRMYMKKCQRIARTKHV